ncbi:MAG: addiction module protein [Verrucomicrobiota bacterium]
MTAKLAAVARDAQSLSIEEKILLAQELVADVAASSPSAYEAAWKTEVQRRREDVLSGKVELVSEEEVEKSLDKLLGK